MKPTLSEKRGRFVTLEGIEGVGKSTNLHFVADCVKALGHDVLTTREPGGVEIAERIRALLLDAGAAPPPPMTELLLMFAARAAHLSELIEPALRRGQWVICDRFTDASYAYQGGGRGLPFGAISALETLVQGNLRPDLTILLDADWHATRERRAARNAHDRFEKEQRDFFERVRAAYLTRAMAEPARIRIVDATRPLAEVQTRVREILDDLMRDRA